MAALSRNPDTPSSVFINIQKHCFELMSLNTLPRFLTESMRNIDQEGIQFRLWFAALPGAVALVALTVIAWTMPSFERRYRWTTSIPAVIFFVGLWQSYLSFCICHGFLGTVSGMNVLRFFVMILMRPIDTDEIWQSNRGSGVLRSYLPYEKGALHHSVDIS